MTVFTRIKTMNDEEIQGWLRKVGRDNAKELGVALVGADQDVRDRVFRNMSPYAGAVLAGYIETSLKSNCCDRDIVNSAGRLERMM